MSHVATLHELKPLRASSVHGEPTPVVLQVKMRHTLAGWIEDATFDSRHLPCRIMGVPKPLRALTATVEKGPYAAKLLLKHMQPIRVFSATEFNTFFETWNAFDRQLSEQSCSGKADMNALLKKLCNPRIPEGPIASLTLARTPNRMEILGPIPSWQERHAVVLRATAYLDEGGTVSMNFSNADVYEQLLLARFPDARIFVEAVAGHQSSFVLFDGMSPGPQRIREFFEAWTRLSKKHQRSL